MKKLLLLLILAFPSAFAFAAHITGGEMYYTLVGPATGGIRYRITLKLYRDCNSSGAPLDPSVPISIFNNSAPFNSVYSQSVTQTSFVKQNLSAPNPCIQNPPPVCYETGFYTFEVTLPATATGYVVTYQRCCRIAGINNLIGSSAAGATYTAIIPGTNSLPTAPSNNSARFIGIDTVITCANNTFCYDFSATDPDGDSLSYNFSNAFLGGSQQTPAPNPPSAPVAAGGVYSSVNYSGSFSGSSPLGSQVTINPQTGLMCGVAPAPGIYVVTVSVNEYRQGVLIATQRKDLQIKVGDCNIAKSVPAVFDINGIRLQPGVSGCKSFTYTFANDIPPNPLITSYYWEVSDGATYTTSSPTHTFQDTGFYTVKLVINRGQDCSDSLTTSLRVYPGFFPGFTTVGVCANTTIRFFDTTRTIYGAVNSWNWNFDDPGSSSNTSTAQNPTHVYNTAGQKNLVFVVRNSVGCIDTVRKPIDILTRPPITLAFKDTLICNGDTMQLRASGNGNFSWSPTTNMINPTSPDPLVHPTATTSYVVTLNDQGCIGTDTVRVQVVNFVSLQAMPDTLICIGDSMRLRATTNGLQYLWDNASTLNNPALLNPTARPIDNPTVYTITSRIGPRCFTRDTVVVSLTPYSSVSAGSDTTICYNNTAQLNGATDGRLLSWVPTTGLNDPSSLTPTATLRSTTTYVLSTVNGVGCISRDTVTVNVNPEVFAFAGRDTAVVVGQPLQFNASGGETYQWTPSTALSSPTVPNPKAVYNGSFDSIRYFLTVRDSIGCDDQATVLVKIFRTNPRVFVPSAFSPNGDGKNEIVAPVAVGLTKLDYFRIYNRWGQLVFETTINGKGWDGRIAGQPQGTSTYVWIVKGTDFTGKSVFEKGTVTLIR